MQCVVLTTAAVRWVDAKHYTTEEPKKRSSPRSISDTLPSRSFRITWSYVCIGLAMLIAWGEAAGSVCVRGNFQQDMCLSLSVARGNITFSARFDAYIDTSLTRPSWVSWGISSLACGSMYPASMWVLTAPAASPIHLEERLSVGHVAPPCIKRRLSSLLSAATLPNGTLVATWTRPLIVPRAFATLGYINITSSNMTLIAAGLWDTPVPPPVDECTTLSFHSDAINGLSPVNFLLHSSDSDDRQASQTDVANAASATDQMLDTVSPCRLIFKNVSKSGDSTAALVRSPHGDARERRGQLVAPWGVCGGQYTQAASISPATGTVTFLAGPQSRLPTAPGFALQSVIDPNTRTLYSLALVHGATNITLLSFSADTGASATLCTTPIPLPDSYPYENLGAAWEPSSGGGTGSILVSFCTELMCVTTVTVGRLSPIDCSLDPIITIPADPSFAVAGSAAYDSLFNRYVFVAAISTGSGVSGPVLAAVSLSSRRVTSVIPLSLSPGDTASGLAFDSVSGNIFAVISGSDGNSPVLYSFNTRRNTFAPVGSIFAGNVLTFSGGALDASSGLFYLVTQVQGKGQLVAVNISDTSVVTTRPIQYCQYYAEDCPAGLAWL